MAKLDKKRDYATIFGVAGHRYEQDGIFFDQEGNEVGSDAPKTQQAGSRIDHVPGPSKAEIDAMIEKARQEGIAQGKKEAEEALPTQGPAQDEILVIDKDLNDYTSKAEVVSALEEIKEKYLPDLEWDGRAGRDALKETLANAIELVKGSAE